MSETTKVYGMSPADPLWLTSAIQSAAVLHWPDGLPPAISTRMEALHASAAQTANLASELAAVLLLEGAEGVEGETVTLETTEGDDEDEEETPDEEWR